MDLLKRQKVRVPHREGLTPARPAHNQGDLFLEQMHFEAAKMLSFTEEEFMKALDWGKA